MFSFHHSNETFKRKANYFSADLVVTLASFVKVLSFNCVFFRSLELAVAYDEFVHVEPTRFARGASKFRWIAVSVSHVAQDHHARLNVGIVNVGRRVARGPPTDANAGGFARFTCGRFQH